MRLPGSTCSPSRRPDPARRSPSPSRSCSASSRPTGGLPRNRQTMFFSATLDGKVGTLARSYTNSPSSFDAEQSTDDPGEVEHRFVSVTTDTKVETLADHLRASDGITLVFVRTKRGAD